MLSLVKMGPAGWRYFVEEIASGREDYWAERDAPSCWLGRGADGLGLAGEAPSAEGLARLFGRGAHPLSGSPLGKGWSPGDGRAVAGFQLMFAPPKTVSVLWALADRDLSGQVLAAHEAAVSSAMRFPSGVLTLIPEPRVVVGGRSLTARAAPF